MVADLLGGPGSKREPRSKHNPPVAGSFLDWKRYSEDRHSASQQHLFSEDPQFHRTLDYQYSAPAQYTAAIRVSQYADA